MNYHQQILTHFELHSAIGIADCFKNGVDPNSNFEGKPLIYALLGMYTRSPAFADCVRVFVNHGLELNGDTLQSVLLNDTDALEQALEANPGTLHNKYTWACAYTPLHEASLLHICAEYNHTACAEVLLRHGLSVDTPAGADEYGFGGQTPIFHTVNQHANHCLPTLQLLLQHGAHLTLTVPGLVWGKGFPWETFIPSVNPISYAMMGLLRQFQRTEKDIYQVVAILMKADYHIDYRPGNVPNRYLHS